MPNSKEHLVSDVQFVLDECARFQGIIQTNFRLIEPGDHWCTLPSYNMQRGMIICGRAAHDRLVKLAELARKLHGLHARVELDTVLKPLKLLLTQLFIRDAKQITIGSVEKMLAASARAAGKKCKTQTHLIPCHLMWGQEPDFIPIGPVTFRSRKNFRDSIARKARRYALAHDESNREVRRLLLREALGYFDSFKWVAEVTIERCDRQTSESLAARAVTSALDCLHLLFGAENSENMRVAGPRIDHDKRAKLQIDVDGDLDVNISSAGMGEVGFPKGWSSRLDDDDHKRHLQLSGIALEAVVDPDLDRPLSSRFLDAAQWYGEAVREVWGGAKVVKFVTALERMVMTEERDDITRLISERVAALCLDELTWNSLDRWQSESRKAYSLRSKLVHGSMSPGDLAVNEGIRLGSKLARATLILALERFGEQGLRAQNATSKRLGQWFGAEIVRTHRALMAVDPAGIPPGFNLAALDGQ